VSARSDVIREIDVADVATWLASDSAPVLLDVRDPAEHATGCIGSALLVPRALLETRIAALVPDQDIPIVAYCAAGQRSLLAARALAEMGYQNVSSMRGGFAQWQRAGHRWIVPALDGDAPPLTPGQAERYARHLRLAEIGIAGQKKLLASRVLCIGVGGLGSPASLYLAAAGVGTLGIIDADVVDLSNLQRQVVHGSDRIGIPKVDSAAFTLARLNPEVRLVTLNERLTAENAPVVLAGFDVIVDGSDNFTTRYLVNDAALRLRKPVVHAAIQRFEGQLTVFAATGAPCYRCVFPHPPPADAAPSCAEAGVLGVLPGVLGVLQATEAIKLVLGIGESLAGRLLTYDALSLEFNEVRLRANPACPACGSGAPVPADSGSS